MKSSIDNKAAYRVRRDGAQYRVAIVCGVCKRELLGTDKPNCPPGRITKHFKQKGWEVHREGVSAKCPECIASRPAPQPGPQATLAAVITRPAPTPLDSLVALLNTVPKQAQIEGRKARRDWMRGVSQVAEVAAYLVRLGSVERLTAMNELHRRTGVSMPTLYRFLHARRDGTDWPEVRAAMLALGAEPIPPTPPKQIDGPASATPTGDDMSREAIKAQHKMFELLREHFEGDGKVGRYREGWSDARIAKETGLAVVVVAETRETLHGRIDEPELAQAEADLAALRAKTDKELGEMRQLLDNLQTESNRRIDDMTERLRQLREKRR